MKKIMYCSHLILGYCILFTACTLKNDFKITKEFADSIKQYSYISNFSGGMAKATKGGKDGFIDKTGKQVIPCVYGKIEDFSEGMTKVIVEGEYRLIPCGQLQYVEYIGKCGFIDKTGKQIIPCVYDDAEKFSEGTAKVKMGEKWGFIDKNGKQIVPCIYDQVAWCFSEGMAKVKISEKWGFVDKNGKQVISYIYEDTGSFSESMAKVKVGEKWGFIDKKGKQIIPCIYEDANNFSEGMARVKIEGRYGFIDKKGKQIIPCIYDWLSFFFQEEMIEISIGRKCGFIDKTGKQVIPCIYDQVHRFSEGMINVKIGEKWGFVNKNGEQIIPCIYDTPHFQKALRQLKSGENGDSLIKMGNKLFHAYMIMVTLAPHFQKALQ